MAFPLPSFRLILFIGPMLALICWFGLRDKPDPIWAESTLLLRRPVQLLQDVPDSLQMLYCSLHGLKYQKKDSTALKLISKPTLSNIEWQFFKKLTWSLASAKKHRAVVAGVTGVGSTKQAIRAANLIAGSTDRVLQVDGAPQFDLEYHKKYVGYENEKGVFIEGDLLRFWDQCRANPGLKYVAIFDNIDKMNPETFLGPIIWEALSTKKPVATFKGKDHPIPNNFYMISVTHLGPGSITEFNEEHFKRLGEQYVLEPNPQELKIWFKAQLKEEKDELALAALKDSNQLRNFMFFFLKMNQLLKNRYGDGFQLGQGSNARTYCADASREKLQEIYMKHINSLVPNQPLKKSDFKSIDYTIKHGGLAYRSSFIAQRVQWLKQTGYFIEITMVAATAILTALFSWWVFRRKEQLIRHYGERTRLIFDQYEHQQINSENAARQLEMIKKEVDALVLNRKLGYTEGLYFLAFIEDKVKRVEFAKNVSENFLELFNAFMDDDVLTENEYLKLKQFLQSMKHKIPDEIYEQFNRKVEHTYAANRSFL